MNSIDIASPTSTTDLSLMGDDWLDSKKTNEVFTLPIKTVMLERISYLYDQKGGIIFLSHPIFFNVEADSDGFYYSNTEYGIVSGGETQRSAKENIIVELNALYDLYAREEDDRLDENARALKRRLIDLLGDDYAAKGKKG